MKKHETDDSFTLSRFLAHQNVSKNDLFHLHGKQQVIQQDPSAEREGPALYSLNRACSVDCTAAYCDTVATHPNHPSNSGSSDEGGIM